MGISLDPAMPQCSRGQRRSDYRRRLRAFFFFFFPFRFVAFLRFFAAFFFFGLLMA